MKIFALNSSAAFGEKLAQELGIVLSKHKEVNFEDGEHEAHSLEPVQNEEVFVVQSLYADNEQTINDKLCRLLFFIGSLKDASAKKVTAVVPYLCYARKDQKSESMGGVTTRYVASLFEAVKTDAVITIDVHSLQSFQNSFRIPTENLEAEQLFAQQISSHLENEELVVLSPDIGGIKRAEKFQKTLQTSLGKEVGLAFMEKYRKEARLSGETVVGEVKNKTVVLYDDMISTGKTLAHAAAACERNGANKMVVAATHGLFAADAADILQENIHHVFVANTVPPFRLQGRSLLQKTTVVDITPLFGDAIRRMTS